ncbi:hypothetical protein [Azospirillum sp. sgz301742]
MRSPSRGSHHNDVRFITPPLSFVVATVSRSDTAVAEARHTLCGGAGW